MDDHNIRNATVSLIGILKKLGKLDLELSKINKERERLIKEYDKEFNRLKKATHE